MSSSAVRSFADADAYSATIRAGQVEIVPSSPGPFSARLTRIDLHDLWMQRFAENLPQVAHLALNPGRAVLILHSEAGHFWNGIEIKPLQLIQQTPGEQSFLRSSATTDRLAMSLPMHVAASTIAMLSGSDFAAPKVARVMTPRPAAVARLHRLHTEVCGLAGYAPELVANTDVARGFEQLLIEAWAGCLDEADDEEDNAARADGTRLS